MTAFLKKYLTLLTISVMGLLLISCTNGFDTTSTTSRVSAGPAAQLSFASQPDDTPAGGLLISPVIQILDAINRLVTSATNTVTLSIGNNPSGGTLSGTLTATAVGRVVRFSTLSIDKAGQGYTLSVVTQGLSGATSNSFIVTGGVASQLAFITGPTTTLAGDTLNSSVVEIQDSTGNLVTTSSAAVAIGTNPGAGILLGTTTVNAVNGIATFQNLSIASVGTGYIVVASSSTLTSATSNLFDLTANRQLLEQSQSGYFL